LGIVACQLKSYHQYYMFVRATHLLELTLGVLRTMQASQRNFDALQFEERVSFATT